MNYREGQKIKIWNLPNELSALLEVWTKEGFMADANEKVDFLLGFVQDEESIRAQFEEMKEFLNGDAILWFAYPKGSSKRYKASINRDKGWKVLGENDMEAVRQIAINEDWSALRFRKIQYIKTMTRKFSAKDQS
ncbi:hypothetical protein [Algoriphagus limi]|uniref:DUF3052 domain-containing protein n=1 Tax=Algoriphagus limi TaxID=2975273 RepID=A0ABT2G6R6_9BACT|nr:hypothetical protein [Algoriphagus limi]MCS5490176.1 hypothetical protein [Algoriphagus limi]